MPSKTHLLRFKEPVTFCGSRASVDEPRSITLDLTTCPGCLAALLFDIQARAPKAGVEVTFEIGEPRAGPPESSPGAYLVQSVEWKGQEPERIEAQGPRDAARKYGRWLIEDGGTEALNPEEFDTPMEVIVTDLQGKTTTLFIGPAHVEVDVEVKEKP